MRVSRDRAKGQVINAHRVITTSSSIIRYQGQGPIVTGSADRSETIIAGLRIDGELRIVGRSVPLKPTASRAFGKLLKPSDEGHPWPSELPPDRYGNSKEPTPLVRVEPLVVEVSADTAWSGRSFRHPLRYLRPRPELDPNPVSSPFNTP